MLVSTCFHKVNYVHVDLVAIHVGTVVVKIQFCTMPF